MAGRSTGVADRRQGPDPRAPGHLSVAEAVSYIDRTISPKVRAQVEHHLIHCEACLQEVIEVTLFLRELNGPERTTDGKG